MQKTLRYIAVDDNPIDLLMLKEYAKEFPFLQQLGTYSTPADGLAAINELNPDLLFLDVEMPGSTGIELLKQVKEKVPVAVFITSHPEFAIEGFELSALDYIVKPLTEERFAATARRIEEYWAMKQKAEAYEVLFEAESLTIKEGHTQVKLPQSDIIYLEAMQDYTKVVTEKRNYLTLTTLTAFLEKLSDKKFMRVHRSYAVALGRIKELHAGKIICGNNEIPVGKTYRSMVTQIKL